MKIHVKNINADYEELYELLCLLQNPFITNKDTHTFYNCDELFKSKLQIIENNFKIKGKTILIITGGL